MGMVATKLSIASLGVALTGAALINVFMHSGPANASESASVVAERETTREADAGEVQITTGDVDGEPTAANVFVQIKNAPAGNHSAAQTPGDAEITL